MGCMECSIRVRKLLFVRNALSIIWLQIVANKHMFVTCADRVIIACLNAREQNAGYATAMDICPINVRLVDNEENEYIRTVHRNQNKNPIKQFLYQCRSAQLMWRPLELELFHYSSWCLCQQLAHTMHHLHLLLVRIYLHHSTSPFSDSHHQHYTNRYFH